MVDKLVAPFKRLAARWRRKRAAPKKEKKTRSRFEKAQWPIAVIAVIIGLGTFFYFTSARTLREPIVTDYSASEVAFRESISLLLGPPLLDGNRVEALVNGRDIFSAMLEAIRRAEKSVTLETYIWTSGVVSDQFIEALCERARSGLKVHAIADGAGTMKLRRSDMERMKEAGVEFVLYGRERWYHFKPDVNHRTHRKLLIIDGKVGFTGGVCIDDSWYGTPETSDVWRDTQYRVEGPAVKQMQAVFAQNWLQTTARLLQGPDYFPPDEPAGDVLVQCFISGPRQMPENARVAHLLAIAAARKSIRLSHAYFVPDNLAIEMLLSAIERGVEVEVIVPYKNDSRFGRAASRSRWGKLLAAGAKFYQYTPALYHCKAMIVDDIFVSAGSVNFDNRSFAINDEANINVLDRGFARDQIRIFKEDVARSQPLTLEEFRARPIYIKAADHFAGLFRSQF